MVCFVRVSTSTEPLEFSRDLIPLLGRALGDQGKLYSEYRDLKRDGGGWSIASDVIVALGSAGVFSALYQALKAYLSRSDNRQLVVETEKAKIEIKGHTLPEEAELLEILGLESGSRPKQKS